MLFICDFYDTVAFKMQSNLKGGMLKQTHTLNVHPFKGNEMINKLALWDISVIVSHNQFWSGYTCTINCCCLKYFQLCYQLWAASLGCYTILYQ